MSDENVEAVVAFLEAQSDAERFYAALDPYVVFINRSSALETKPFVGHEGVRDWARNFREAFGEYRIEATEMIDAGGDQVIAVCQFVATGVSSGVPVDGLASYSLFTLLNHKIVRCQGFDTREEAFRAAGVSE